jgi:hypothetical protein
MTRKIAAIVMIVIMASHINLHTKTKFFYYPIQDFIHCTHTYYCTVKQK